SELTDISGEVYKFTIAPQITPGRGHFARPAIRMFVTYACWSDDFETFVAPTTYGNDTDGITFGVQAEAWW
ncbi:MAG: carbohydrate porin, partial [Coraliomargarita sp.]